MRDQNRPRPAAPSDRHDHESSAVLTLTLNPAIDVCTEVPVLEPERKLHCLDAHRSPGGGGINVARAVRRLGHRVTAVFPHGGSTGALLCQLLRAEGVSIVGVPIDGITREDFSVREQSTGREFRFVVPGPVLTPADVSRCLDKVARRAGPGRFVVVSGSTPPDTELDDLESFLIDLRALGSYVVVDTSGDALAVAARSGVSLLKPSVNELSRHTGRRLSELSDIVAAADDLRTAGPSDAVLVSLGARGAVLLTADARPVVMTPPGVPVVSVVGAGDSLVAGVVCGLRRGESLREAACRGVAAGTAATIAADHQLCHPLDVQRLLGDVEWSRFAPLDATVGA
jgi:6-phosphofructokinase 2